MPAHSAQPRSVAVIMPTFNNVDGTLEAIASALAQIHDDLIVYVIDDGSTAENQAKLASEIEILSDKRVQYHPTQENIGVAHARNVGLSLATQRYIAFLDCDDLWTPEKLAKQLAFMAELDTGFSFTDYENYNPATGSRSIRKTLPLVDFETLETWNVVGNSTVILDRDKINIPEIPNLRRRQDFALWLTILRAGHIGHGLREPLTIRRILDDALSSNKITTSLDTWKMYRYGLNMSVGKSTLNFVKFVLNGARQRLRDAKNR